MIRGITDWNTFLGEMFHKALYVRLRLSIGGFGPLVRSVTSGLNAPIARVTNATPRSLRHHYGAEVCVSRFVIGALHLLQHRAVQRQRQHKGAHGENNGYRR